VKHADYLTGLRCAGDRLMLLVMAALMALSLGLAPWYHTWQEALFIGAPTLGVVAWLVRNRPGALVTRVATAAGVMVFTGLHIHQAHGMLEMHFGVFVLLAFLLCYRDWVPLVVAAGVIATHHLAFDLMQRLGQPVWVFAAHTGFSIVLIHAAYVVFETALLVFVSIRLRTEIDVVGCDPAQLARVTQELAQGNVEVQVPVLGARPDSLACAMAAMRSGLQDLVQSTASALQGIAEGDLSRRIASRSAGEFGRLQDDVNRTVDFLTALSSSQRQLVEKANAGDFSGRCDINGLAGYQLQIAVGLNDLVGTVQSFVSHFARAQSALASADLTQPIAQGYSGQLEQLRQDCNRTVEQLTVVIGKIRRSAEMIRTSSAELAQGNTDLSVRTEEQASVLREIVNSIERLSNAVRDNAAHASTANQLSTTASQAAARGGAVVAEIVCTMQGISASSGRIGDIVGIIQDIAFQTNLLALNAAVEAARAGEQGRGFAVVASEVRALAGRSATAAREIKELISDSVSRVDDGAKLVTAAGATMGDVVSSIEQVTRLVSGIAVASKDQSAGIDEISRAISQMDEVTQQNAAAVEEAAAAADRVAQEAAAMRESVLVFRLADDPVRAERGGAAHAARRVTAIA
jgi:methyl-accepting chemotaxis protein